MTQHDDALPVPSEQAYEDHMHHTIVSTLPSLEVMREQADQDEKFEQQMCEADGHVLGEIGLRPGEVTCYCQKYRTYVVRAI